MTDHYLREDMMLITVGDDPIAWGASHGGAATSAGFEPLTLTRIRSDRSAEWIARWTQRIGQPVRITQQHLDQTGEPTGRGLKIGGTVDGVALAEHVNLSGLLDRVELAACDANSFNIAYDRLIIIPTGVESLTHEKSPE